jgi:hypothetical protein
MRRTAGQCASEVAVVLARLDVSLRARIRGDGFGTLLRKHL